jgi:hypothetical protein
MSFSAQAYMYVYRFSVEAIVVRRAVAGGLALAAAVAVMSVSTGPHAVAGTRPATVAHTLITGERVRLAATGDGRVTAALTGGSGHFTTMSTPTAQYVVPDEARPYLGRQLDLSLFDVTSPPAGVEVTWAPGASRHAIPGLAPDGGRVTSGAAFGAALRRDARAALAGVAAIRATSAAPSVGPGAGGNLAPQGPGFSAPSVGPGAGGNPAPHFPLATLVVKGLDRAGAVAGGGTVSVINVDDAQRFVSLAAFYEGTVAFSVPVGRYTLSASISTPGQAHAESLVVLPEVTVGPNQTLVSVDARTATVAVPVPAAPEPTRAEHLSVTLGRVSAGGAQVTTTDGYIGSLPAVYVTPVAGVTTGELHWYSYFRLAGDNSLYDVEFPFDGRIPAVQPDRVDPATLARLDSRYHDDSGGDGTPIATYRPAFLPWERFVLRPVSAATAPLSRTEHVTARPDLAWVNALVWRGDEVNGVDQSPRIVYRPGERAADVYLTAPLVPGAATGTVAPEPCTACREGDTLGLSIPPWSDGTHAISELTKGTTLTVTADAELFRGTGSLWHGSLPSATVQVPAGPGDLRLVLTTEKSAPWTTTAIRTSTAWTWRSGAGDGPLPAARTCPGGGQDCALEPLLFLSYDLGAGLDNAIPAGQPAAVTIRARHQMFDPAPPATALSLEVSGDDGATWTPVETGAAGDGVFGATLPPAEAGFLSLRVRASDPWGDAIDQTVVRAVRVTR